VGNIIVDLLPVVVSATVVPFYIVAVLVLLQSDGGLIKALGFVAGGVAMRLVQGLLFGLVFGAAMQSSSESGQRLIVSTLLLVLGILLLITAFVKWQKAEDPDAPPRWMATIRGLSAGKAVGAGALFVTIAVKQWVFTLSAIGVISEADLGEAASAGLYLFYVVASQMLVLVPILVSAVAPQQALRLLEAAQSWLERHNREIAVTVSLVFGGLFLYKGVTGLIG
jgi:Sap, sulfolipid-1-addressing protein